LLNSMDIREDLLERLLIIQSLLEQDRGIMQIEQKVNAIISELSVLNGAFQEEEGVPLSLEPENRILRKNAARIQKLLKILEKLEERREDRKRL
jgi:Glu-tRNA(Gln) amidotransferase subunit E-like FAD-binding protein